MASSSQTPEQPQQASGNASSDSDADSKYAGQADAGDTSFAGEASQADRQSPASATPKTVDVNVPQTANPPGAQPQPGTGLDSPGTDDADQADAGDTSFDPGKGSGGAQGGK